VQFLEPFRTLHFEEHRDQQTEKCNSRAGFHAEPELTLPQMPGPAQGFGNPSKEKDRSLKKPRYCMKIQSEKSFCHPEVF
jgi:hypothetical protein